MLKFKAYAEKSYIFQMNSQKQNDALRAEQQLIDHLLNDIQELKESKKQELLALNQKYQEEITPKCKEF